MITSTKFVNDILKWWDDIPKYHHYTTTTAVIFKKLLHDSKSTMVL